MGHNYDIEIAILLNQLDYKWIWEDYGFDGEGYAGNISLYLLKLAKKSTLNSPLMVCLGNCDYIGGVGVDRLAKSTLLTIQHNVADRKPGTDSNMILMKIMEWNAIETC